MRTPDHQNVTLTCFLWVSSRSLPKPFKLILLGILINHATDTYPSSLQKKRGFFDVPRPYKEQMFLTRSTCVMSHNGGTNNRLRSTRKYHDNVNTSFRGHQFQPSWIATKAVSSSKSIKFVTFPYMASS